VLSCMAVLNEVRGVPKDLLPPDGTSMKHITTFDGIRPILLPAGSSVKLSTALGILKAYSLSMASQNDIKETLSMHRVLHNNT
jgi:hypothetical protein